MPEESAAVGFAMGIVEDITERKNAEEQLRRSKAYLTESQRLSHIGSWAFTISPRQIVFWSQEHYRIFGFDPDSGPVAFQTAMARIHPEDRPAVDEAVEQAIRAQADLDVHYRIVLPDETIRYCSTIGHPVADQKGEVVEFIGTVMDVTERKQTEKKLQNSFEQLRTLAGRLQSVREEERARVAREIHDELGQAMTAIKMDLTALILELPADGKEASKRIERSLKLVDGTIQAVRRIATELRPGILDDLGLAAAVEWAAEEFQARTGITCHVSLPASDIALDPECATALFRIFQETLTNVARHAKATGVDVTLARNTGGLFLEVHDDGKGISDEELSERQSLGILGMRERALLLGGELTIIGAPGKGTTVKVRIPSAHFSYGIDA